MLSEFQQVASERRSVVFCSLPNSRRSLLRSVGSVTTTPTIQNAFIN
jgi:hypothetical protein